VFNTAKKTVLQNLPENTSDHHPIKLSIDFEYSLQPMKQKDNKPGITKVKWEKVDKELVPFVTAWVI
jgi:hypothetical protein